MKDYLPVLIGFLIVLSAVTLYARRLHAPVPVLLAVGGAVLALVPGVRRVPLQPDMILFLFLPPLLYADAFQTSWIGFRQWIRPILMLATGLVALTMLVVGLVAHALMPGLPWAACFLLGAIVSPTDTIAVQAVIERLRIPRRITAIVGGESLVNDATGLVGVQVASAVILSGAFEAGAVVLNFAWVAGGGIAAGLVAGALFAWLNRVVRETRVLFALSLLSPYLAFWVAHALEASGVLAVVVAGFVVAWRIHDVQSDARFQLYSAWSLVVYLLNGLCFVYIGMEAPRLFLSSNALAGSSALAAGAALAAVVIGARILWCLPGAYLPLALSPKLRAREGGWPRFRHVLIVSWCGVRGVVSLAAALALPHELADGSEFPGRDAIIACTICVILVTLFAQGLTLQPLIHGLGIRDDETSGTEARAARERVLAAGIARLDEFCSEVSCPLAVHHYRSLMADELATLRDADLEERQKASVRLSVSHDVRRAVAIAQARELLRLRDSGAINDKSYVELQLEIDRANLDRSLQTAAG